MTGGKCAAKLPSLYLALKNKLTIVSRLCNQLSTVNHSDISIGSAGWVGLQPFDFLYDLKARDDQPENYMHSKLDQQSLQLQDIVGFREKACIQIIL